MAREDDEVFPNDPNFQWQGRPRFEGEAGFQFQEGRPRQTSPGALTNEEYANQGQQAGTAKTSGDAGSEYSPPPGRGGAKPPYRDIGSEYSPGPFYPGMAKPAPVMPAQPKPPPPIPFTNADGMQLQKLQNGLSSVQSQLADGIITQDEATQMQTGIMGQLQPLQAKQEQHKQKTQQEQQMQVAHQRAQATAMDHHDQIFRAKGIQDRMITITDPLTGRRVMMLEKRPNEFQEIEFPEGV